MPKGSHITEHPGHAAMSMKGHKHPGFAAGAAHMMQPPMPQAPAPPPPEAPMATDQEAPMPPGGSGC